MEIIRNDAEIGLPPYSEYKDSNVEWFGNIPMHWKMPRLGSVLQERAEVNVDGKVEQVLSVLRNIGVIPYEEKGEIGNKRSEDITRYKIVRPDDLVVNSMNVIIGSVGLSRYTGCLSPVYYVLKTRREEDVSSDYYGRVFQLKLFQESLVRLGNGILAHRMRIPMEKLKAEHVPQPPLDEQQAIVRYLDHIDRRVRRYIRAKQRLLALLREQKQAIIHQAVTRGLDASAPLKPSGVAWLGEVPAHWEVVRFRYLVSRIEQGIAPLSEGGLADGETWGVLKAGCVNGGVFRQTEHKRLPNNYPIDPSIVVRDGDVLISRASGSSKLVGSVGRVHRLDYKLVLSDKTFRPVFKNPDVVDFLVAAMNDRYFRIQVEQAISGAEGLANNLPQSELRDFRLAVPPPDEAASIAATMKRKLQSVEGLLERTSREISLIQEYRTRLIADVVTGKVDVRAAAAALPAEVGEEAAWAAGEGEEEGEEVGEEDGVLVEEA